MYSSLWKAVQILSPFSSWQFCYNYIGIFHCKSHFWCLGSTSTDDHVSHCIRGSTPSLSCQPLHWYLGILQYLQVRIRYFLNSFCIRCQVLDGCKNGYPTSLTDLESCVPIGMVHIERRSHWTREAIPIGPQALRPAGCAILLFYYCSKMVLNETKIICNVNPVVST